MEDAKHDSAKRYVFEDEVTYSCATGHSTTGEASGDKSFKARCTAEGDYGNMLSCRAVACPSMSVQPHAQYPADAELFFPDKVQITCDVGHALDPKKHTDVECEVSCEFDGKLASATEA